MAKTTIAELQEKIKKLESINESQMKYISDKNKKLIDFEDKNNVVDKINYDTLLRDFENLKEKYKILESLLEKLKSKKENKITNARGAGRKRKLGNNELKVTELKESGLTVKDIAQQLGIGTATVNRILKRQSKLILI